MISFDNNKLILALSLDEITSLPGNRPYDEDDEVYRADIGMFHLDNVTFPQCFEYHKPFDAHFCGDYYPCDAVKMKKVVDKKIVKLEGIRKILDVM